MCWVWTSNGPDRLGVVIGGFSFRPGSSNNGQLDREGLGMVAATLVSVVILLEERVGDSCVAPSIVKQVSIDIVGVVSTWLCESLVCGGEIDIGLG